jgi:hypothetical protein
MSSRKATIRYQVTKTVEIPDAFTPEWVALFQEVKDSRRNLLWKAPTLEECMEDEYALGEVETEMVDHLATYKYPIVNGNELSREGRQ